MENRFLKSEMHSLTFAYAVGRYLRFPKKFEMEVKNIVISIVSVYISKKNQRDSGFVHKNPLKILTFCPLKFKVCQRHGKHFDHSLLKRWDLSSQDGDRD